MFAHRFQLIDAQGQATPLILESDGRWQRDDVVLLDFENGADHCDNGTTGTHTAVRGTVAPGEYVGLRFVLGVPFNSNHVDPATATAPLNIGQMNWGWQGGFKFFRFEGTRHDASAFRFHLGSTGCEGAIGAITRCTRPNRAVIDVANFQPRRDVVAFDLATLLDTLPRDEVQSCMAEVDDAPCAPLFAALGLDVMSGESRGGQTFFVAQSRAASVN